MKTTWCSKIIWTTGIFLFLNFHDHDFADWLTLFQRWENLGVWRNGVDDRGRCWSSGFPHQCVSLALLLPVLPHWLPSNDTDAQNVVRCMSGKITCVTCCSRTSKNTRRKKQNLKQTTLNMCCNFFFAGGNNVTRLLIPKIVSCWYIIFWAN